MKSVEREELWQERVQQWRSSGLSQRGYALQQGYPVRQVGYWVRRLSKAKKAGAAMMPVRVVAPSMSAISLRNERGWTLTLPGDVPAGWLAELMRAL
jgi:hypothetical protein